MYDFALPAHYGKDDWEDDYAKVREDEESLRRLERDAAGLVRSMGKEPDLPTQAGALYRVNKAAKEMRDKQRSLEKVIDWDFRNEFGYIYDGDWGAYRSLLNAKDKKEELYDLKDRALKALVAKTGAVPVGFHVFPDKPRDLYRIEGFAFHSNRHDPSVAEPLGTIEDDIPSEVRGEPMDLDFAVGVCEWAASDHEARELEERLSRTLVSPAQIMATWPDLCAVENSGPGVLEISCPKNHVTARIRWPRESTQDMPWRTVCLDPANLGLPDRPVKNDITDPVMREAVDEALRQLEVVDFCRGEYVPHEWGEEPEDPSDDDLDDHCSSEWVWCATHPSRCHVGPLDDYRFVEDTLTPDEEMPDGFNAYLDPWDLDAGERANRILKTDPYLTGLDNRLEDVFDRATCVPRKRKGELEAKVATLFDGLGRVTLREFLDVLEEAEALVERGL